MKYAFDETWTLKTKEIAKVLGYTHVILEKLSVIQSSGTKTKRTIARIHVLGKVMMLGMGHKKSFYVIELISEKFDKQTPDAQTETIIHELMHIPHSFGGGFRNHKQYVTTRQVRDEFIRYQKIIGKDNFSQHRLF